MDFNYYKIRFTFKKITAVKVFGKFSVEWTQPMFG